MIIVYNLMVQLGLSENFKHQFHQWDFATLSMKEPIGMIWQTYLTSCEVRKEVVKTLEPFSTREATERLAKILDSTYANPYL